MSGIEALREQFREPQMVDIAVKVLADVRKKYKLMK
jgi:hypothetical protein